MKKVKIRMSENGVILDNRSLKKGETAEVDRDLAEKLVSEGRASHTTRVKVIRAGLFGSTWREPGDEFETSESMAVAHYGQGTVELLDPRSISEMLPEPKKHTAPAPKPGPYDGQPLASIRVKRSFLADSTVLSPGADPVEVPESIAAKAVAAGAAEFTGLRGLTERGKRFFDELLKPVPGAVPQY